MKEEQFQLIKTVLWIHDILVRIRIRILGSVPLSNVSGNLVKSHKEVTKQYGINQGFSYYFVLDDGRIRSRPLGPNTCGSHGSGSAIMDKNGQVPG
jgi:hypothetical protein